jgi:4-aminobutyrate aminotransferase / (S)-3-amino-2-methylpropionate transaminase / 5-aminovalerate transaminase
VPFAHCYRCSYSLKYPECKLHCAHHLEDTFKRVVAAESVAAVIVEPVLGEGGFITPPPDWLRVVQEICHRHGILLIADEVQTGFGRTGKIFACEHYGVEPDLIVTAKSLGGGLPLGGVTGKAEIMDNTGPGSLGGTFGGNPLACEAALAVLDALEQGDLCNRATHLGERFRNRAMVWKQRYAVVGDVRGLGAMQAIELVNAADAPNADATKALTEYCLEHGVILVTAGTYGNVVRVLMPLVITDAQMDEALDVMEAGLAALALAETRPVAEHAVVS